MDLSIWQEMDNHLLEGLISIYIRFPLYTH